MENFDMLYFLVTSVLSFALLPHYRRTSLRCYLCLMTNCKKTKISLDFSQRNWWSKNPVIWLDVLTYVVVSDPNFPWWLSPCKNLRYWLIPSKYTDDQRILQSNSLRAFLVTTEQPDFTQARSFWILQDTVMDHF